MDDKKDTNLNADISALAPDNKRAEERKLFYQSLTQKTEKVSTALYMVTSHMDDREGIKNALRDTALAFVLETIALEDPTHQAEEIFQVISLVTKKLSTLLSMSATLGMISETNSHVLNHELARITEQLSLGHKFYALTTLDDVLKTIYPEEPVAEKSIANEKMRVALSPAPEKRIPSIPEHTMIKKEQKKEIISIALNSERKNQILKLIKDKGEVSIKDIAYSFSGCSEKTIQRDINALVEEGKLNKTGDRRWSRYSIKK